MCIQTTASASVPGFETRPVAGRRSKTVAFVAILALLTFGTLALGAKHADVGQSVNNLAIVYAHSRKAALGANAGQSVTIVYAQGKYSRTATAAVVAHQTGGGKADKWTSTPRTGAFANLLFSPVPVSFEYAQWANQSSAAAAIQLMSTRFASSPVGTHQAKRTLLEYLSYHPQSLSYLPLPDLYYIEPLKAEEVQMLLGPDEALVFFLVGANESYVFALTREGVDRRTISLGEKNMAAKVAAFRRGLDVDGLTKSVDARKPELFDLATAHEFYLALLGPVEALIKDKPQLLIVPLGPITALPFHLVVTDKPAIAVPQMQSNDMTGYRDAAWLVKRHAVTVLPSVANLKALRVLARKGQATKPMIGFGDPVFAPDQNKVAARTRSYADYWRGASVDRARLADALPPLPDSAEELNAVAAKLGASSSDIHLGRNATEANVKRLPLADYRVVYFATHGLVAGDVEGLGEPSLALTLPNEPSELDDGLLTASEVAQLKLDADWVVLSACNTAAGEKPGAEALSGLARAFFYAGARATGLTLANRFQGSNTIGHVHV